ncbi:serine hydrolase [Ancylomarina salipaludis]|uniref:Serine hydrolase n=1 Tax=Ancylomarina salipaludis TaxID=2501299 RepID=A0A4Q1JJQ2_9BACT|nr:serine hydrolase [Ancylomarina salipaludis]RXQ90980.1 serine hydrolase [Ancylomarina salipaludis]
MKKIIYLLTVVVFFSCTNDKSVLYQDSKVAEISNYLDTLDGFSGVVLIAKNDSIVFKKTYGFAHLGHRVKNNTETKFTYASIGKSFTAVAIFQLIQAGKLALDDPIGKFFPNYPNKIARDSITIRLLLTHRSGLPNYFATETFKNTSKDQFRSIESLTFLYENKPLEFKPDEAFAYRNTNYILLGRIIEKVTQTSYEQYIKDNVFSLAKMENTGNFDIDHPINNAAENYTLSDTYPNKLQKTFFMGTVKGGPAGGGFSTLNDLYQFATAFKNKHLLNASYTAIMKTEPESGSYGYGMQFAGAAGSGIYGHSGGHFGVGAEWRVFEKQNYTVVLLTNKDLDQGFLDARFFIEKTISGSTPKLEAYFFTKKVVKACLYDGVEYATKMMKDSNSKLSEIDLNAKGYEMIKRGNYPKAIELFKLETLAFPNSYDAYDSLGEAYMNNGNPQKAIKNYKKSLALNSDNLNAKEKIKELTNS